MDKIKKRIEMSGLTPEQRLFRIKYKSEYFDGLNFAMLNLNCAFSKVLKPVRILCFKITRWIEKLY